MQETNIKEKNSYNITRDNSPKRGKVRFVVYLLILASLLIGFIILNYNRISFYSLLKEKQSQDYSLEYKKVFTGSDADLLGAGMFSIVFNPEEREQEKERVTKSLRKHCREWEGCTIENISLLLEIEYRLSPNNINKFLEDENLILRIKELYENWKATKILEASQKNGDFSQKDRLYLYAMRYMRLLEEKDKSFWLIKICEPDFSSLSPEQKIITLRFVLDISNINKLKDLDGINFDLTNQTLCGNLGKPQELTSNKTPENLRILWYYIARKDFCQIPRTEEEKNLIKTITSENYLSELWRKKGYFNYEDEYKKYLLLNSEKIFQ